MKRVLVGGFLSVIGSIWTFAILLLAGNHLVSSWANPPGRLLTTVSQIGLLPFLGTAVLLVVFGIAVMIIEFFKKER